MYKTITRNMMGQSCLPFTYTIPVTTMLTTAGAAPAIGFDNASDFIINEIRAIVQTNGIPDTSITMALSFASGDLLQNAAVNILSFAQVIIDVAGAQGIAGYPKRLPEGIRIPANSVLNVALQNNTADTVIVQIQFDGYKVEKES
jgi:hypothetical protein